MPDDVALDVAGEDEGQAPVDGEADVAAPATGLGEPVGEVLRPGQPGTGQVRVGQGEPTVGAGDLLEQRWLRPAGIRGQAVAGGGLRGAPRRAEGVGLR
ncbi:hypothetical protein [Streptomyces iranensis]|uniref:Uncharacterized protein n=1 Tax=Streptomyces iranensis TaxID=576784 RepID=A0ABS4N967_9ACTN|nr:hypothetical protein [Streptomyces iranensis]MBP2067951.1 hypothetical protein [Streptomyces iranensis]